MLPGGLPSNIRKVQAENGDFASHTLNLRRTLMKAHDRPDNCQAKTGTAIPSRSASVDSIKKVEQVQQMLRLDPWAWVGYK